MAPRKEKNEMATADAGAEMILTYLKKQNRPYSAADISANLHGKVTKSAAVKILKELHERKEIEGRASGKQLVYHPIQNPDSALTTEELAALDTSLKATKAETQSLQAMLKTLKQNLATLDSTMSTADLRASVFSLEAETAEMQRRLNELRSGKIQPVAMEDKVKVEAELSKWTKVETRRKTILTEMWGCIMESLGDRKKMEEVREKLGLEDW